MGTLSRVRASWVAAVVGAAALGSVAAVAVAASSPDATPGASGTTPATSSPTVTASGEAGQQRADEARPENAGPSEWAGTGRGEGESQGKSRGLGLGLGRADRSDDPVTCDGARNHGQWVSWVARTTPAGPDKDAVVAQAAERDCGKPEPSGGAEPTD
jgi:hypothetical protein